MRLKVLLPTEILIDQAVEKVVADGEDGSFGLLPHHINFVTALATGILSFVGDGGKEEFVALDGGVLVKAGQDVMVSTPNAIRGAELGKLRQTMHQTFHSMDVHERKAISAAAKLEADLVRKFMEFGKYER